MLLSFREFSSKRKTEVFRTSVFLETIVFLGTGNRNAVSVAGV